jgi:hypothetical protein
MSIICYYYYYSISIFNVDNYPSPQRLGPVPKLQEPARTSVGRGQRGVLFHT